MRQKNIEKITKRKTDWMNHTVAKLLQTQISPSIVVMWFPTFLLNRRLSSRKFCLSSPVPPVPNETSNALGMTFTSVGNKKTVGFNGWQDLTLKGFPIVFQIIHLQYGLFDVFLVMPPKSKHDKMAMPKWSPDGILVFFIQGRPCCSSGMLCFSIQFNTRREHPLHTHLSCWSNLTPTEWKPKSVQSL